MGEEQLFPVILSLALLIWLLGRGILPNPRRRRQAEIAAMGLVAAGLAYALIQTLFWFTG